MVRYTSVLELKIKLKGQSWQLFALGFTSAQE